MLLVMQINIIVIYARNRPQVGVSIKEINLRKRISSNKNWKSAYMAKRITKMRAIMPWFGDGLRRVLISPSIRLFCCLWCCHCLQWWETGIIKYSHWCRNKPRISYHRVVPKFEFEFETKNEVNRNIRYWWK